MEHLEITHSLRQKLATQKWVQARVEIGGKQVSIIGEEWFDKIDVTLSSRPIESYGEWNLTQQQQVVRYLDKLVFGPYQNTGSPEYEAAVETATEKLKSLIKKFEEHYDKSYSARKTHFVFCEDHDEFSIIITVNEG